MVIGPIFTSLFRINHQVRKEPLGRRHSWLSGNGEENVGRKESRHHRKIETSGFHGRINVTSLTHPYPRSVRSRYVWKCAVGCGSTVRVNKWDVWPQQFTSQFVPLKDLFGLTWTLFASAAIQWQGSRCYLVRLSPIVRGMSEVNFMINLWCHF